MKIFYLINGLNISIDIFNDEYNELTDKIIVESWIAKKNRPRPQQLFEEDFEENISIWMMCNQINALTT